MNRDDAIGAFFMPVYGLGDCDDAVFPANCLHASIKKISQNKETKGGKVGEG
jgi:hypothetical protein